MKPISLLWLRRDLRLHDHAPLAHALKAGYPVQPVFIFDPGILSRFNDRKDRRLSFIADALLQLDDKLKKKGGGLLILHGQPQQLIPALVNALHAEHVFAGEDYEPAARARDASVAKHAPLKTVKDHVLFGPGEILRKGAPYRVFTPYSKLWKSQVEQGSFAEYVIRDKGGYTDHVSCYRAAKSAGLPLVELSSMLSQVGYDKVTLTEWPADAGRNRLKAFASHRLSRYAQTRDFPAVDGTSRLSPYIRFGLISIRECARAASQSHADPVWLKELIWRDFYTMILAHFPNSVSEDLQEKTRGRLQWSGNTKWFKAWQEGRTGYPIVDAAMRQLAETGWMHNRMRMVTASFLSKHLRIDWRWGEEHFAQLLMDYELASNVGGWAASTGTDAQPWFRVFNPTLQSKKFDKRGEYIRRYVPELKKLSDRDIHEPWKCEGTKAYPPPIVEHKKARFEALAMFKKLSS